MASIENNIYTTTRELPKVLEAVKELNLVPMIWGKPGIGKSDMVRQFANLCHDKDPNFDNKVIDIRLANRNSEDIYGIPQYEEDAKDPKIKRTGWAIPKIFPMDKDWKGIIFFDEINLGQQSVMNSVFQIVQERTLDDKPLPAGAIIIAAGNNAEYSISANEMSEPLKNRFVHIYLIADLDSWLEYEINRTDKENVNEDILAYLKIKPDLFEGDAMREQGANQFATPRSWDKIQRIINNKSIDLGTKRILVGGLIGATAQVNLFNYLEDSSKYQDPKEIYEDGKSFKDKEDLNAFYGCFMAGITRISQEQDRDIRTKYVKNFCKGLMEIKNREVIAFAAKMMLNASNISEVISGKDLIELSSMIQK